MGKNFYEQILYLKTYIIEKLLVLCTDNLFFAYSLLINF